jgi:hypothetical protein
VNAGENARAASFTAVVAGEILAAIETEPLPLHEISARIARSLALCEAVLRLLRHRGLVVDGPGDDHVTRWRAAR